MSDNKRYYYMRLKADFFDSDSMVLMEGMKDGYLYSNILLKLYLKSLKDNGRLMLNKKIPYSATMIASITRHQVGTVEKALQIFEELGLIEILDSGAIYMLDIQDFIGESSTEADRKRRYRERIKEEQDVKKIEDNCPDKCPVDKCPDNHPPEIEIEIEKEIDIEIDIEIEKESEETVKINYQLIADMYNNTCVSFPKLTKLSEARKKAIKARLRSYSVDDFQKLFSMAEESDFLKGKNQRNWSATFDWLIKDSNMAKVLDGNYSQGKTENNTYNTDNSYDRSYMKMYSSLPAPDEDIFS